MSVSTQKKSKRFTTEEIKTVVQGIVNGHLLIEEAMDKFDIKAKRTISNWLIKYLQEQEKKADTISHEEIAQN